MIRTGAERRGLATRVRRLGRRLSRERAQVAVEFLGMVPLMLISALLVWQLLLAAYAVSSAENAARTASRAEGVGRDGEEAARSSLSFGLDQDAVTTIDGERAEVSVRVPIIAPGVSVEALTVTRDAELPET